MTRESIDEHLWERGSDAVVSTCMLVEVCGVCLVERRGEHLQPICRRNVDGALIKVTQVAHRARDVGLHL